MTISGLLRDLGSPEHLSEGVFVPPAKRVVNPFYWFSGATHRY
jgi:hypothetical protein